MLVCCDKLVRVWAAADVSSILYRSHGYERVYLPLCKVADTPFHIQGDKLSYPTCIGLTDIYSVYTQK